MNASPNHNFMEEDPYDQIPELPETQSTQSQTQSTQANSQPQTLPVDNHLWGFLQPYNPILSRIDFWKIHPRYSIGRNTETNTIVLPGFKVSNQHCIITWDGVENVNASVIVTDLSSNGTFINGVKIGKNSTRILREGNEIAFGTTLAQDHGLEDYRFIYRHIAAGPPTTGLYAYYDVDRVLGKGSFATVMKAVSLATGEWFAVKMIKDRGRPGNNGQSSRASVFAREIAVMEKLRHPNICQLYEVFYENDNDINLVLELVDGGDLLEYVLKCPEGVAEVDAQHITFQICHAMAYIHSQGVAHRDLKPENILLTKNRPPIVKVADFGLAKIVDSLTMLRTMCGTPSYLAPEVVSQVHNEGYDNLVDSWSVGVIVFSMFTNSSPFNEDERIKDISERIRTRTINWELLTQYHVSADARDFIHRLLDHNPATRMSLTAALEHVWLRSYTPVYDLHLPAITPSQYFPPPHGNPSNLSVIEEDNSVLGTGASTDFGGFQVEAPSFDEIPGMTGGAIRGEGSRLQRRANVLANAAEGNGDILEPSQEMIAHATAQDEANIASPSKGTNKRVRADLSIFPEDLDDEDMDGSSDSDDAPQPGKGKGRAAGGRLPTKRGGRKADDDDDDDDNDSSPPLRRSSRNPPSKIARRS